MRISIEHTKEKADATLFPSYLHAAAIADLINDPEGECVISQAVGAYDDYEKPWVVTVVYQDFKAPDCPTVTEYVEIVYAY